MDGPDADKEKMEKPLGGAFCHTYAYDELNRLIRAEGKANGLGYAMDMSFGLMGEPLTKVQRTDSGSVAGSYALTYEYGDSDGLTIIGVEDAYQQTFTKYSKTPIVKSTRITGAVSSYSRQTTKNIKSRSGSKTGVKVSAILGVEIGIDLKKYGMWLKMLFSKIYLAALSIVFVVTIVLLSICGILTLFKMLQSYVIAGSITSMMDVITKYGVLILLFQFTSHFVLVFIMDHHLLFKKITALIIQYRAITYFLVYGSLGMFSTHLLLFYLGNEAYRNTTERYYGNTLTYCARFPLLNVLVYGKILILLHRKGYRVKVAKLVLLYFTGRLAYFLLCEKENNMIPELNQ